MAGHFGTEGFPMISVIMPAHNEEERIAAAVESVFSQSFEAVELIVVDDASSDGTVDVLRRLQQSHPALTVVVQPDNQGPGPARNAGLARARGEFIAFLDADDSWHPECLATLHDTLRRHPEAALTYCGWQNIGLSGPRSKPFVPPDYETPDKVETLLRGCRWPIHGALTRKRAIDDVGGFDEQWSSSMDYDLWLRVGATHRIVLTPQVLAYYHHHGGEQITKNRLRVALNHIRIQENFLRNNPQVARALGRARVRDVLASELSKRAYVSFWGRDLPTAHALFRRMLASGRFRPSDLKYAMPALLPYPVFRSLVARADRGAGGADGHAG